MQLTSGTVPPSGSFTYDSATTALSDFLVEWDTITFNFTAVANSGLEFVASSPGTCGLPAGPVGSFALLSGLSTRSDGRSLNGSRLFGGDFSFFTAQPQVGLVPLPVFGVPAPSGPNSSNGTFSIAAVPEPATGSLFALGLAVLGAASGRMRRRQG